MRIPDLVFIVVFLVTTVSVLRIGISAARRRWDDTRRLTQRTAAFAGTYLAVVVVTALATPRRWIEIGEEQRFDDWALTAVQVQRAGQDYRVTVRVANRGRGRPQRAADAEVMLVGSDGRRFAPLETPDVRSLRSVLHPGESFETDRQFMVPANAEIIGLDVIHGAWPGLFIIGDRGSLFTKRPLVRLD